MTDLEITRLCAEAMGWHTGKPANKVVAYEVSPCAIIAGNNQGGESVYDPLHDDAQAMALVKKFRVITDFYDDEWLASIYASPVTEGHRNLNHAICKAVAKMQAAKSQRS